MTRFSRTILHKAIIGHTTETAFATYFRAVQKANSEKKQLKYLFSTGIRRFPILGGWGGGANLDIDRFIGGVRVGTMHHFNRIIGGGGLAPAASFPPFLRLYYIGRYSRQCEFAIFTCTYFTFTSIT